MARPKMLAKREQFITHHRFPPVTDQCIKPGNERVSPISRLLLMTRSSLPPLCLNTSVPTTSHKGITREEHDITSTLKKAPLWQRQNRSLIWSVDLGVLPACTHLAFLAPSNGGGFGEINHVVLEHALLEHALVLLVALYISF